MKMHVLAVLCLAGSLCAACAKPIRIPQSVVYAEKRVNVCPVFCTLQFGPKFLNVDEAIDGDDPAAVLGFRGVEPPTGRDDVGMAERAACFDRTRTLAAMLDAGVDPDARVAGKNTLLHRAADNGAAKSAALLLDRGADIDAVNVNGWTPLALAVFRSDEKFFKLMLERGADIAVPDREGYAVLDHPCLAAEKREKALRWIAEANGS